MTVTSTRPVADRRAWVEHLMGMPVSIHARGEGARSPETAQAVAAVYADLRAAEALFSTYRADSQVSRLQRGEVTLADVDPQVREVDLLCRQALIRTDGWFDAWNAVPGRPGVFDPTGLVKTWAVARAGRHLRELADATGLGYAVGAGGDVLTRPATDGEPWRVGIEDPLDRTRVLARIEAFDGGVATSGITARGAHIVDPRTGERVRSVLSATVAGPSLMWADVVATALVAMGPAAVDRVPGPSALDEDHGVHEHQDAREHLGLHDLQDLHGTSGLIVLADGSIHRWPTPH